ncbi:MAG: hypothetical protein LBH05_08035 [Deferribacteraceae bacterium]|jgi:hypothetical protein|nr:hypothetical protein [Deferribacteraceae bacterium]
MKITETKRPRCNLAFIDEVTQGSFFSINYLKRQVNWRFVNYLSPMLFGIRNIRLGNSEFTGNFAMRHLLTSFGTDVSAQVFLKYTSLNMAFTYHNYQNYQHYFPAIEAELIDYPFYSDKFGMLFSPRIIFGTQPEDQRFKTGKAEFLGLAGMRVGFMVSGNLLPYIDFTVKTDGWITGNEYLNSNANSIFK